MYKVAMIIIVRCFDTYQKQLYEQLFGEVRYLPLLATVARVHFYYGRPQCCDVHHGMDTFSLVRQEDKTTQSCGFRNYEEQAAMPQIWMPVKGHKNSRTRWVQ